MKIQLLIAGLLCLCAGLWGWYDLNAPPQSADTQSASYPPMPSITLIDLGGQPHDLGRFKGRTVLLNIWATWCAPCVKEFPDLLRIAAARPDDLTLIALSVDAKADNIPPFLKRFNPDLQAILQQDNVLIAHDPTLAISQEILGTSRYPETYIITPEGRLMRKIAGVLTAEDIQSLLPKE